MGHKQTVHSPEFDPGWAHTFVEFDHEIMSAVIFLLPRKVDVSYKRNYVHKVLVNCFVDARPGKSVVR